MPARTAYRQLQAIRDRLPQYRPHARPPQLAENILALKKFARKEIFRAVYKAADLTEFIRFYSD